MMSRMRRAHGTLPAALAFVLGIAAPDRAPRAQPASPSDDATLAQAKQHFERGKELFKSAAYEEAIREFKVADQIKPSPILAYNIGLAYDKLGRCRAAVGFFQRYLREQPDADNRADTEQKIAEQQAKLARGECLGQRPAPTVPSGNTPPAPAGPTGFAPVGPDATAAPPGTAADAPPIGGEQAGMHPIALGLRFGPIFGGLGGKQLTQPQMLGFSIEGTTGFHVRPAVQFPMILLPDGRSIVQGEIFGTLALYGFDDRLIVRATMSKLS
jgi:hypothetical protein